MAGYKAGSAPVDLSIEAIDGIVGKMQDSVQKVDDLQGKMVKLRNAEVELLKSFEAARNYMLEMLQKPDEGREALQNIFGGDCVRIARIRLCLDSAVLSDMYASDARFPDCRNACESVEKVLEDLGLGAALRRALEEEKALAKKRKSTVGQPMQVEEVQVETPVVETPVIEEPPPPEPEPPKPEPPKKKDIGSEALDKTIDESLIDRILACTTCAELAEIQDPKQEESLGNWMIWMVHRAHLDDPTLEKFDFTNLQMPPPAEEPRISPKLAKAIANNTHITSLLLPNTNLMAAEGGVMAESLIKNSSIKVLNIDSNFLAQPEMESLANAAGTNQTLEEIRVNNQHGLMMGRSTYEAFANACKANKMITKLGLNITDPTYRNDIDRSIMRNNDDARKRRVAAKKAAEAAAA
jgi:hypothetical protein